MSYGNEAPVTAVPLDGFWIMRTEVTNAAYATCVKAQACIEPNSDTWADASAADYPVTNVTWYHASQYAAWVGGRLPTEAEWEAACRGPNDQIFPWGNDLLASAIGNFGDREDGTMPVGSYPDGASPFGVLDMAGNVWEWTSSHYTEYPYAADDGREAPGDDGQRVVRGGSFSNGFQDVRCSMRDYYDLFVEDGNGGFRVVMSSFD
jgi:formylglycine-generating enzyme required for sulfatase activity